jgi:hypothetical protein
MAITFTREYSRAEVVVSQDGLTDVVVSIYCNLKAIDGDYTALAGETIALDPPQASQFIPFDQITQDLCDLWVTAREQYKQLEAKLADMIAVQQSPPVVVRDLPFNTGN